MWRRARHGRHRAADPAAQRVTAWSLMGLTAVVTVGAATAMAMSTTASTPTSLDHARAATLQTRQTVRPATAAERVALGQQYLPRVSPASIIAASMAEIEVTAHANDVTADQAVVVETPPTAGKSMLYPVDAPVTSGFGFRVHPVHGDWRLHTGTDFGAACGTPTVATRAGTVTFTGEVQGYGLRVVIDHGTVDGARLVTTFNHLSVIGVRPGQEVKAGDPVARVGTTGTSTGCHLHFEVVVNGAYADPMPFLDGLPSKAVMTVPVVMTASPSPSPSASPTPSGSLPLASATLPIPLATPSSTPSPSSTSSPTSTTSPSPSATGTPSPTPDPSSPSPTEPSPTPTPPPTEATPSPTDPSPSPSPTDPSPSPSSTATSPSPTP